MLILLLYFVPPLNTTCIYVSACFYFHICTCASITSNQNHLLTFKRSSMSWLLSLWKTLRGKRIREWIFQPCVTGQEDALSLSIVGQHRLSPRGYCECGRTAGREKWDEEKRQRYESALIPSQVKRWELQPELQSSKRTLSHLTQSPSGAHLVVARSQKNTCSHGAP